MLRSESRQALSIRKLIPKPVVPLPMPAREILKETDYNLVTHYHPDHFSADYLPKDAPIFFRTERTRKRLRHLASQIPDGLNRTGCSSGM